MAIYQNKTADKLLEEIRQSSDDTERKQKLEQFQNILNEDAPAVFCTTQIMFILFDKEIKGVNNG